MKIEPIVESAAQRYASDAARWTAVQQRDRAADGVFYYGVRSTGRSQGVYCRPSCPSRPALREHVSFHASTLEAEAAGFRPCLRCRPDGPPPAAHQAQAVAEACRLIDALGEAPDLDAVARAVGMSRYHFQRVFKAQLGVTPKAYASAGRAARVRAALAQGGSVTEAIYAAGFNASSRFYAGAGAMLGMAPARFRDGGANETIRFAVGACSLGAILVAATGRGICAILMGDDPEPLVRDLQDRFPKAQLIGADPGFEQTVALVVGFVEAPRIGLDLPLDVRGTAFQQRVWEALRTIPAGDTVSYTELAHRIGSPAAVRAVAGACAANPVAVAIPCHRVVRTDGGLSGYRWGIERKAALIAREKD
ncbi:MAG: AraC family transcriptional regulator [Massilia sp.]|jgi:AraC family transcriptional regulator of adaptative response/methylated-DNA-[protein]-cysteine methyltransferase